MKYPTADWETHPYDCTRKNLSRQPLGKTYFRHRPFKSRTRSNIDSHRHFSRDKFVPSDVQSQNQMRNPPFPTFGRGQWTASPIRTFFVWCPSCLLACPANAARRVPTLSALPSFSNMVFVKLTKQLNNPDIYTTKHH